MEKIGWRFSHQGELLSRDGSDGGCSCTDHFRMPEAVQCIDCDVLATTEVALKNRRGHRDFPYMKRFQDKHKIQRLIDWFGYPYVYIRSE